MNITKQTSEFLSAGRVAGELELPLAWIKAEAKAGRLPVLQVGRCRMFNLDAVRRALNQRAETPSRDSTTS